MAIVFYSTVIACLLLFPAETSEAALHALKIWGTSVVPFLFPYMVFSRHLSRLLSANTHPPVPAAALLGMLGGSPSGAAMLCTCVRWIPARSFYALCMLTGTISPMFILGTIRNWSNDPAFCRLLLLCHWAGAVIGTGIIAFLYRHNTALPKMYHDEKTMSFASPVAQSIDAILQVGGNIIACSVLAVIWRKLLFFFSFMQPLLHAALVVSGGAYAILKSNWPSAVRSIAMSAALGFSGISILSQNHYFLHPYGIKMTQLLVFALLRSIVSALCMAMILGVLRIS